MTLRDPLVGETVKLAGHEITGDNASITSNISKPLRIVVEESLARMVKLLVILDGVTEKEYVYPASEDVTAE